MCRTHDEEPFSESGQYTFKMPPPPPYTLNSMWQAPLYPLILYEFSGCFSAFVILLAALCKGKTLIIHHIFWDLNILLENVFLFFGFFLSSLLCLYYLVVCEIYMAGVYILWFIAPKASAEGACILSKWVTVVGYCDDGVSAGIWVIHTGPKSGGHAFWRLLWWWCECWYMGHTYRSQI